MENWIAIVTVCIKCSNIAREIHFTGVPQPQVTVSWRAPKSKDLYPMTALGILLEYLTDTAVSPLQKVRIQSRKHEIRYGHLIMHSIFSVVKYENSLRNSWKNILHSPITSRTQSSKTAREYSTSISGMIWVKLIGI